MYNYEQNKIKAAENGRLSFTSLNILKKREERVERDEQQRDREKTIVGIHQQL